MKKTKKTQIASILGIIAIVAVIGFGFIACGDDDNDEGGPLPTPPPSPSPNKSLDGVWHNEEGKFKIKITDSIGVYYELDSGSTLGMFFYQTGNKINLGSEYLRKITKTSDLEWLAEKISYSSTYNTVGYTQNNLIKMSSDGLTFELNYEEIFKRVD